MRSVVLAYHDVGYACLEELLAAGAEVALVISHHDDPGENVWFRSVAELARGRGIPVECPADVNAAEVVERVRATSPDFLFSAMFRQLLKRELLEIPRLGALNLHPSLLPRYRGRAPLNWALVHGESETGVSLHYMVEKPDRGDVVAQRAFPIGERDTALDLHRKAAEATRLVFREAYPLLAAGRAPRLVQDQSRASYFGGRKPADGEIDWQWPARRVYNLVRAVTHPYPGAFTWQGERRLFVWWALPATGERALRPGEVNLGSASGVEIGTADGALALERVQPEGEEEIPAGEWARRGGCRSGEVLGRTR